MDREGEHEIGLSGSLSFELFLPAFMFLLKSFEDQTHKLERSITEKEKELLQQWRGLLG